MEAHVISLPDSKRYSITKTNLENAGIKSVRWDAVRGSELTEKELKDFLTLDAQMNVIENQPEGDPNRLTKGAVGCALSHRSLWEYLLALPQKSKDYLLIFEDDVKPNVLFLDKEISKLLEEAGNFDIMMFHYWPSPRYGTTIEPYSRNLNRSRGVNYSFLGYVITREGAKKLLQATMPLSTHIDVVASFVARRDPSFKMLLVKNPTLLISPNFSFRSTVYGNPGSEEMWRGRADEIVANPLRAAKELDVCRNSKNENFSTVGMILFSGIVLVVLLGFIFSIVVSILSPHTPPRKVQGDFFQ